MNTPLIPHEELRQRYNPDGSLLRRQQMRMLHILVEVDKICQRHNIRYWLSSGTLIGAVRHGGFIPWDDDLDIEMMRAQTTSDFWKYYPTNCPKIWHCKPIVPTQIIVTITQRCATVVPISKRSPTTTAFLSIVASI